MLDAEFHSPPRLRGFRELAAGRAALDGHFARLDEEATARQLETLLVSCGRRCDNTDVVLAAWLVRLDGDQRAELRVAAERADCELAAALLDAPRANRGLLRRGRLPEVAIRASTSVRFPVPRNMVAQFMGGGWWHPKEGGHLFRFADLHAHARYFRRHWSHYVGQLCAHPDASFIRRLLDAPWLDARDVLQIASRRPITEDIARAVAESDRWFPNPKVRGALATNRFTPPQLVLSLLPTLGSEQLRWLSDPRIHHPVVAHAALLLLKQQRRQRGEEPVAQPFDPSPLA